MILSLKPDEIIRISNDHSLGFAISLANNTLSIRAKSQATHEPQTSSFSVTPPTTTEKDPS